MNISVIIATHKRKIILEKVLKSLEKQTLDKNLFEVIVVEDKSCEAKSLLENSSFNLNLKYFKNSAIGASAARNYGAKKADGNIILFLDNDMLTDVCLLEEHLKIYSNGFKGGVLGNIKTPQDLKTNLFTQYLLDKNLQNTYEGINPEKVSYHYFYTGNISLGKDVFLKSGGFDEAFYCYGFEDLELGYRLSKQSVIIKYNQKAVGFHYFDRDFLSYLKKKYDLGRSAVVFAQKHPELKKELSIHPRKLKEILLLNAFTEKIWLNYVKKWEKNQEKEKLYPAYEYFLNYYYVKGIRASKMGSDPNEKGV